MILVYINRDNLQVGARVLVHVESLGVDKEHPNVSVEVSLVELRQLYIRATCVDLSVDLLVVVSNPVVVFVSSEDRVQLWDPDILHVEQHKLHIVGVAEDDILGLHAVLKNTLSARIIRRVKSQRINTDGSVNESERIAELEADNQTLRGTSVVWERGVNALADEQELKREVEVDNAVDLSEGMNRHSIDVLNRRIVLLVLLVGKHRGIILVYRHGIIPGWNEVPVGDESPVDIDTV